jgi:RNase P subunit RPR2
MIGRRELKRLKQSVLVSLFDLLTKWGFVIDEHYRYNSTMGHFEFINGSQFVLMDLAPKPSDPNYERLGSLEFTGEFIEEAAEVEQKAKDVAFSRIRYKLSEFCGYCNAHGLNEGVVTQTNENGAPVEWLCRVCGQKSHGLPPKLLMTCNPHKGYLYKEFYKPYKTGQLSLDKAFIQALVTDNPYISPHYIESLKKIRNKAIRERLLKGNWEYADDELALMRFDQIQDIFTYQPRDSDSKIKYLTADVARFGRDKAVIMIWEGLQVIEIITYDKSSMPTLETEILVKAQQHRIPMSRVLVDEDGIGGGIVDHLKCKGFVGNAAAIDERTKSEIEEVGYKLNFQNQRTQCYYELSEKVADGLLGVVTDDESIQEAITEELEQIRAIDVDKDQKFRIIGKDDIKLAIGRSPDYADTMMMRMYFEVKPEPETATMHAHNPLA